MHCQSAWLPDLFSLHVPAVPSNGVVWPLRACLGCAAWAWLWVPTCSGVMRGRQAGRQGASSSIEWDEANASYLCLFCGGKAPTQPFFTWRCWLAEVLAAPAVVACHECTAVAVVIGSSSRREGSSGSGAVVLAARLRHGHIRECTCVVGLCPGAFSAVWAQVGPCLGPWW